MIGVLGETLWCRGIVARFRVVAGVAVVASVLVGCDLPGLSAAGEDVPPTEASAPVVVVSEPFVPPPTATAVDIEPPTPTFSLSFAGLLDPTPIPLEEPRLLTPEPLAPLPEIRPTRTPVPTATSIPTATPIPTRVVLPREDSVEPRPAKPVREPTPTPVDDLEPNDTREEATDANVLLDDGETLSGILNGPNDADVFRVDVPESEGEMILLMTFSGLDAERYRLVVHTPSRGALGFGRSLGATARQARISIRGDVGEYYVEVTSLSGQRLPRSEYTLSMRLLDPPLAE